MRSETYDDDFDDADDPLESDTSDASDDLAEMACPSCGKPVIEDTQKCPHCGDWITPVEPRRGGVPKWVYVVVVVLMLILALLWSI